MRRSYLSSAEFLKIIAIAILLSVLLACGGSSPSSSNPPPNSANPVPVISSISPNTATRGGPAFTLTVNGLNFVSGAIVRWNGNDRPTTFIDGGQVSAEISADDIVVGGKTENVTIFNPPPGGGTSNSRAFNIPCVLAPPTPASSQTRARLGAYYFDGWAGPLDTTHLAKLLNYPNLQPLYGWRDDNTCAVEQQLAWAKSFGLSFFLFDWYYMPTWDPDNYNSAIEITHALPDRHGMQFAILYVDEPFIPPAEWDSAFDEWISYMKDPAYLLVNGKPYFGVFDMRAMRLAFGSSAAVKTAFDQLRAAARARGLPGVYIVGCVSMSDGGPTADGLFPDLSSAKADGYDAISNYAFPIPVGASGELPYSTLAAIDNWTWSQAALKSPLPMIPVAHIGADARVWGADPGRDVYWIDRGPQEFATHIGDLITLAESSPRVRAASPPSPPLVLITAWNELDGGGYMVPTVGDGTSYGDGLGSLLATPVDRIRTTLTINDTGSWDLNRMATGQLTDANGTPISGASIVLTNTPDTGTYAAYQLSGQPPVGATQAIVGFRVNTDDPNITWPGYWFAGPSQTSFSLYRVSYIQPADGTERVSNGDFSSGMQSWTLQGQTQLVPSDRGAGQMAQVIATPTQFATLDSQPFAIVPGAPFQLTFYANLPPSSSSSGYFLLAFTDSLGNIMSIPAPSPGAVSSETLPFALGKMALGTATTDSAGNYQLSLTSLGASSNISLEATYAGDAQHWPAYAKVDP